VTRLPVRLRLTLAFGVVVTLVLSVVAVVAYAVLAHGIRTDLDRELRQRAQDLGSFASTRGRPLDRVEAQGYVEAGESFAEVQDADGRVLDATSTLGGRPLLSPAQARRATTSTFAVTVPSAPGLDEPARLLATPVTVDGRSVAFVLGVTEGNRIETLSRIRHQLLVGIPLLALLATLGGYVLVGVSLRPVERMRSRAAAIREASPGQRLPVPPGQDALARLGTTLNDLLTRLEESSEQQRAFVANASHELRTPLALMALELELAVRRERTPEELTDSIRSAQAEVARLTTLAEDLLVLTTAEDDRVEPMPVDLTELLAGVVDRFAGSSPPVHLAAVPAVEVRADRPRLERALTNLVANAVQHGQGDVEVVALAEAGGVAVHVYDRGPGLDPALHGRAFDRFTRGRATGRSGLGLAIVDAVARGHGGVSGIEDRAGGGADAWIRLPAPEEPNPRDRASGVRAG
jgi:signal transduction histidine kinase